MTIKINGLEYKFDEKGNTAGIILRYQGYSGNNNISCSTEITADDLDEGQNLDAMLRNELDVIAKVKIASWF